jgi:DNA-binding transcriptional LysR family regulator
MRGLVLAGAGIAALPEVLVRRDLAQGHLVELLAGWHIPAMGVYAMWPSNTQRATLTLRLVDFLAERLAALFAP